MSQSERSGNCLNDSSRFGVNSRGWWPGRQDHPDLQTDRDWRWSISRELSERSDQLRCLYSVVPGGSTLDRMAAREFGKDTVRWRIWTAAMDRYHRDIKILVDCGNVDVALVVKRHTQRTGAIVARSSNHARESDDWCFFLLDELPNGQEDKSWWQPFITGRVCNKHLTRRRSWRQHPDRTEPFTTEWRQSSERQTTEDGPTSFGVWQDRTVYF